MEILRKISRIIFSTNSRFYLFCSYILDFITITKSNGLKTFLLLSKLEENRNNRSQIIPIKLNNLMYPIFVRTGTEDIKTIINNVVREEWGDFNYKIHPKIMIDAGAYIGDTAVYFLSRFQSLNVIALEPDPTTFKMCEMNLSKYGNRVKLLNKGLYSHEGKAKFKVGGTEASIDNQSELEIECTTIPTLLNDLSLKKIDLLKMDIEGSEESIFKNRPKEWLKFVDMLIIEFHSEKGKLFISEILKQSGFTLRQFRSVWYCSNTAKTS